MLKQIIIISDQDHNSRIDRWLKTKYKLPYLLVQKGLRTGKVKVNGKKVDSAYRLQQDDKVEIHDLDINIEENKPLSEQELELLKLIQQRVVFEDDNILVINKPYGIAVQNGSKVKVSIDTILSRLRPEASLRLVHRLDRYTTGVLVLAKTKDTARELLKIFSAHQIEKKYLAVLSGVLSKKTGVIKSFMAKGIRDNFESMVEAEDGKEAITNYQLVDSNHLEKISLVEFSPVTGRTHQIRVHASQNLGCPVLGDSKYGDRGNQKMHLHSLVTKFVMHGKKYVLEAKLPDHLLKTLLQYQLKYHLIPRIKN